MAKKNVGIFWDLETASLPNDLEPKYFIQELFELVESLGPQYKLSVVKSFAATNFLPPTRISLASMGVEQVTNESGRFSVIQSSILMWLWDSARTAETNISESIVLVTSNPDSIPFLHDMRSRSLDVIIVSTYSPSSQELCRSANISVNLNEIIEGAVHKMPSVDQIANDAVAEEDVKIDEEKYGTAYHERFQQQPIDMDAHPLSHQAIPSHPSASLRSEDDVRSDHPLSYGNRDFKPDHFHPLAGPGTAGSQNGSVYSVPYAYNAHSQMGGSPSISSSHQPREEMYCQGPEELALFTDLQNSFATRNVRLAVSSLRKTYTKQTRTFKIPVMLTELIPTLFTDGNGVCVNPSSGQGSVSAMLFLLSCIQWCFGVQRGEHVDSFKYKMNKNLAVWLLKILVNYVPVTAPISPPVVDAVKQVVAHILDTIAELNFCMELLLTVKYPNIKEVLLQYVSAWQQSDNKTLSARAVEFALDHGFPHVSVAAPLAPDERLSSMGFAPVPTSSSLSDIGKLGGGAGADGVNQGLFGDFPPSYGHGLPESSVAESDYSLATPANNTFSLPGGNRSIGESYLQQHPSLLSERSINPQISDEACAKMTPDERLFLLVARSPQGLLGARIPSLYREAYGERLRLQGRKLKDVLLLSEKVEMVGSDGPGDKLFRLINHAEYQYLQKESVVDRIRGAAGVLDGPAGAPGQSDRSMSHAFSDCSPSMLSRQSLIGGSQMPLSHVYNPATYGAESLLSGADGSLGAGSLETYRRVQGQPRPGTIGQAPSVRSSQHPLAPRQPFDSQTRSSHSSKSADGARNFSSFYSVSSSNKGQQILPQVSDMDHVQENFQGLGSAALRGIGSNTGLLGNSSSAGLPLPSTSATSGAPAGPPGFAKDTEISVDKMSFFPNSSPSPYFLA